MQVAGLGQYHARMAPKDGILTPFQSLPCSAIRRISSGDAMTRCRFRLDSRPRRSQPATIRLTVWSVVPAISAISRSEEHTSELQSLMRISYAVFCLKKKNNNKVTLYIKYISLLIID